MKKINHSWQYSQQTAIQSTNGKIYVFLSFSHVQFHSLVQLLLPTVKLSGVSQPISIEYKLDGPWFNSSCVYNLKFRKLSNLGRVQFLVMF